MKKFIYILVVLFSIPFYSIFAQNMEDVVYLKNGDHYKGIIIENVPNDFVRIELQGGSVFTIHYSDIAKFTKEKISQTMKKPVNQETSIHSSFRPISNIGLLVQPLGVVQFGPVIQAEFKIAPNTVLGPEIRFVGLGLASHAISDYEEFDASSMAVGIQAKQFLGNVNSSDRFYLGFLIEYVWGGGKDNDVMDAYGYYGVGEYSFAQILIGSDVGYRWRFSSGLFLGLGLITGIDRELVDERYYPSKIDYSLDLYFYAMAEAYLGLEL